MKKVAGLTEVLALMAKAITILKPSVVVHAITTV